MFAPVANLDLPVVMPGLDPGIHVLSLFKRFAEKS